MIFVDTSFWFAWVVGSDGNHDEATSLFRSVDEPLVTSNLVLGETWTLLAGRIGQGAAAAFRSTAIRSRQLNVISVDEATDRDAWRWLERRDDRPYSYVDATSFALMRRHRIKRALTFDDDFTVVGFTIVGRS